MPLGVELGAAGERLDELGQVVRISVDDQAGQKNAQDRAEDQPPIGARSGWPFHPQPVFALVENHGANGSYSR